MGQTQQADRLESFRLRRNPRTNPGHQKKGLASPPRSRSRLGIPSLRKPSAAAASMTMMNGLTIRAKVACKTNHPTDSKWVESSRLSIEGVTTAPSTRSGSPRILAFSGRRRAILEGGPSLRLKCGCAQDDEAVQGNGEERSSFARWTAGGGCPHMRVLDLKKTISCVWCGPVSVCRLGGCAGFGSGRGRTRGRWCRA
jgi:hypothetical protein